MPVSFVFREGFFWSGASELRLWFKKKRKNEFWLENLVLRLVL